MIITNGKEEIWSQIKLLTQKVTSRHEGNLLHYPYWHLLQASIHLLANPLERAYCTDALPLRSFCSVYEW